MTLKELRKTKGISQKEFSLLIKEKETTISMWENQKSKPRIDKLPKIAKVLDTTIDEVLHCFLEE